MGGSKKARREKKAKSKLLDSDSDGWVESVPLQSAGKDVPTPKNDGNKNSDDDIQWTSVFSGTLSSKKQKEEKKEDKSSVDKPGQHSRELNPYWKEGGSGLPQENKLTSRPVPIGDGGLQWLHRAKKRLEEQSLETGVSVEKLAMERWGSLDQLKRKISEAEDLTSFRTKKPSFRRPDRGHEVYKKRGRNSGSRSRSRSPRRRRRSRSRSDDESSRDKRRSPQRRRRSRSRSREKDQRPPSGDQRRDERRSSRTSSPSAKIQSEEPKMKRVPSWMKKQLAAEEEKEAAKPSGTSSTPASTTAEPSRAQGYSSEEPAGMIGHYLTDEEMNKLAAKVLRAEMLGNTEAAAGMKEQLDNARKAKETVILTRTDSKGLTRPLEKSDESKKTSGRSKKVPTHQDKQRIRYFGDDDKYSLKEMFEREKLGTAEDQNEMFSRLAGQAIEKTDDEFNIDDVFVKRAQREESDAKREEKQRTRAIREHKQQTRVLEGCDRCIDNKETVKHLIIAVGSKVYLSLPPHTPLTSGHCLIVPMPHIPSATQTDEDVWEEMLRFRRALVSMFVEEDEDCVFFESAMNLKKWPHMVMECVPLPREVGDLAPIYFKKAILESETEWAQNKKLIDMAGRDVRKAVPKGLPYFAIDFGNQSGFAHVIEDEPAFPKNFAQEIIGGMLDLDHSIWRKPKREDFEIQMTRINEFSEKWKMFDFTQKPE